MKRIDDPNEFELCEFDGVGSVTVYKGSFCYLRPAKLKWRTDESLSRYLGFPAKVLTLNEIKDQLSRKRKYLGMITIFIDTPLSGEILQYGNYGDEWYQIGETCGYA